MTQPEQKICPRCGALSGVGAAYCQNCAHQYRTAFMEASLIDATVMETAPRRPALTYAARRRHALRVVFGILGTLLLLWVAGMCAAHFIPPRPPIYLRDVSANSANLLGKGRLEVLDKFGTEDWASADDTNWRWHMAEGGVLYIQFYPVDALEPTVGVIGVKGRAGNYVFYREVPGFVPPAEPIGSAAPAARAAERQKTPKAT